MKQKLSIKDYEVWVNLGCLTEEQKHAQPVHFSLEVEFHKNLSASITDRIEEALDYVEVMTLMKSVGQSKNFHLIEHLNHEVFNSIVNLLREKQILGDICLTVRKIRVPFENLKTGVEFTCQLTLS